MGIERECYETAIEVLRDSCAGSVPITYGDGKRGREPFAYDAERVELAKWIVQNIWAPKD